MEQVTVTFSLDKALKEKAETYFQSIGFSLETYLESCVRNTIIDHEPNAETILALQECEEMIRTGNYGKTYTDVDEMMRDILE